MNAYQELQVSGIHWPESVPAHIYQPLQATPCHPEPELPAAMFEGLERQMAEFAAQLKAIVTGLRQYYVFPTDSSVVNFLTGHRAIPQILLGAVPHLKTCFGADAVFNLRAPIDEAGSVTLYAVAMWPGKLPDVRDALMRFDDAWWTARSRQAFGHLIFTYELT